MLRIQTETPTDVLYSPQGLSFALGLMVAHVSTNDLTINGVPRTVTVLSRYLEPIVFQFADNVSTGYPSGIYTSRLERLVMQDAAGNPVTSVPRYYDLRRADTSVYRYGANPSLSDYKGLVFYRSPYGRESTLSDGGIKVVRDEGSAVRQLNLPQCQVDVVTLSTESYEIRFYSGANRGVWNTTNGLYGSFGSAFAVYRVEDADGNTNLHSGALISKINAGKTNEYRFTYVPASMQWKLEKGGGLRTETRDQVWDENHEFRLVTSVVRDSAASEVRRSSATYRVFPFGDRVVETTVGSNALETTYAYFEEPGDAGYGKMKHRISQNGAWLAYTYHENGRIATERSPYRDSALDDTNASKIIEFDYMPHVTNDVVAALDGRPRTVTERVQSRVAGRKFYVYFVDEEGNNVEIEEKCSTTNAAYGSVPNQRTTRIYYGTNASAAAVGRIKSVRTPDGLCVDHQYEYGYYHATSIPSQCWFEPDGNGEALRITATDSTTNSPGGITGKTLRSVTVFNDVGMQVMQEKYVCQGASSFERISWTVTVFDDLGHPLHEYRSDGLQVDKDWGFFCCGVESETDQNGIEKTFSYDLLNRLVVETKKGTNAAADLRQQFSYDAANRRLATTISNTNSGLNMVTSSNAYDLADRLVQERDQLGIVTVHDYQDGGRIASTARAGVTNTTENYLDGRTKSVKRNDVIQTWHDYGVNVDGTQWTKIYSGPEGTSSPMWTKTVTDLLERTIRQERPGFGGSVLTNVTVYNSKGWAIRQTSPGQADTLIEYNELGERIRSGLDVNSDGALNLAGPDRVSDSETVYVKMGADWWQESRSVIYPVANSATAVTTAVNRVRLTGLSSNKTSESISIDIHGNQTISTTAVNRDEKQVTQTVDYPDSTNDAVSVSVNGLLISSLTKSGLKYENLYDGLERQIVQINPRTGSSITHFNAKGQVDYTEDATSNRTYFGYSPTTGQRTITTNALGQTTRFEWDVLGQLVRTWGHAPYPVEYEYSDDGRMIGMKTYRGGTGWEGATWPGDPGTADETRWQYEPASGLLTNKLYADGNGTSYSYTPDGKLASRRWARGITTTYSFSDTTGELIGINYSDNTPDVGFTYLRMGQQGTITDGEGTRTLTYDPRLQLSNEVQVLTGNLGTNIISRVADSLGRNAGFEFQHNGNVVAETEYGYSGVGRFDSLIWSNAGMTTARSVGYQYVTQSELLAGWTETNAGFITVREYEPHRDLLVTVSNRIGTNAVSFFEYESDAIGRRTKRYDGGTAFASLLTNAFQYNPRSELTNAVMAGLLYGYRFDNIGNREWSKTNGTELTYLANQLNQYTQIADGLTNNLTYDLDGNLLTDGKWTNTWDGENRLIGVAPLSVTNGSKKLAFRYDYMNRRVRTDVLQWNGSLWQTNEIRSFFYDGWNVISEISNTPTPPHAVTNIFTWGLDLSGSLHGAGGIGGLVSAELVNSATTSSTTIFYTFDGNGNVSECPTPAGEIAAHYEYSPVGAVVVSEGTFAEISSWKFSTKYFDKETGLGCWGYRWYSAQINRWLSRDPMEEEGGEHLYAFVRNHPVGAMDLHGLVTWESAMVGEVGLNVWQPVKQTNPLWFSRSWLASVIWKPPTTGGWAGPCECKPCQKAIWLQSLSGRLDKAWPVRDDVRPWQPDWDETNYDLYGVAWTCDRNYATFWDEPGLPRRPTVFLPFFLSYRIDLWSYVKCIEGDEAGSTYAILEWTVRWRNDDTPTATHIVY